MNKFYTTAKILLLSTSLVSFNSFAGSDKFNRSYYYLDLKLGLISPKMSSNSLPSNNAGKETLAGSLSINKKMADILGLGLELNYRPGTTTKNYTGLTGSNSISTVSWKANFMSLMPTLSVDLTRQKIVRPYITTGIGYSSNKLSKVTITGSDGSTTETKGKKNSGGISWKFGAGLEITSTDMFNVLLEYAYYNRGKLQTKDYTLTFNDGTTSTGSNGFKAHISDHVFNLGLRFKF